jgi:hypothetical protein
VTAEPAAKPTESAAPAGTPSAAANKEESAAQPADVRERRQPKQEAKRAPARDAAAVAKADTPPQEPQPRQRPVGAPAEARSVRQICAGASNFVARDLCEARECMRREFTNSSYCVQLRAQHNQQNSGNQLP